MYDFYVSKKDNPIADIEYVKCMYEAQVYKVEQEKYMKELLFADYVRKVKNHKSRYDYIEGAFREAKGQVGKKKKKEREQLAMIENFIREDFFDCDNNFKITNIISGGWDDHYWRVEFEGYGYTFCIIIPNMNRITVSNIQYAYDGMFVFSIKDSETCWHVKKKSYEIEGIAIYIKEYFQLDKVNEDEY